MLPQQVTVQPPAIPGAPREIRVRTPDGEEIIQLPGQTSAAELYRAARAKRDVIQEQRDQAREQRDDLARELRDRPEIGGADRAGIEKRISEYDARLSDLDKQLSEANTAVAAAAGVPGAVPPDDPEPPRSGPDPEVFVAIPIVFTIFVLFPLAISWSRRIWKRTGSAVAAIPNAVQERLARLEQNVDTIAIEVERISEGQRFMTRLFSEQGARAVGQGAAQPVEVIGRDRAAERP